MIDKKPIILKLRKKLFYCNDCKGSTIEQPIDINTYGQKTTTFINMMLSDLKEQTTYSIISRRYKVSISNVIIQFDRFRFGQTPQNYQEIKRIAV
ncbi:MAG: hypothetical protein ACRC0V_12875, partial [Fusobacteriaceae bacterium]